MADLVPVVLHDDRGAVLTEQTRTDPQRVGPYEILHRLGAGGMGVVYLAQGPRGGRVALKVMNREWAERPEFGERFRQEAEAARRVARFCTAPVLDVGIEEGQAYIATEYVEGPTLWQKVREDGPLEGASLEAVAVGMAVALSAIHRAGIVHRDLKPGNVILSPYGGPRVIDFGIAQLAEGGVPTADGLIGTPPFMSPEQARGEQVRPASDIFAWGSVVAFAGTGRYPFGRGMGADVLYRVIGQEPDLDGLPRVLRGIVARAMAKDPDRRPSARELIDELVGRHADEAEATNVAEQLTVAPSRRPVWLVPALFAAAAVAVFGATFAVVLGGERSAPVFDDSFNNAAAHGWATGMFSTAGVGRGVTGGYELEVAPGQGLMPTAPSHKTDKLGSVRVHAEAKLVRGSGGYGLWCRGTPVALSVRQYAFYIDAAGKASIVKHEKGKADQALAASGPGAAEPHRLNRIEAECSQDGSGLRLSMSVNGREVASFTDPSPYPPGAVGVAAFAAPGTPAAGTTGRTVVRFESFSVRELRR